MLLLLDLLGIPWCLYRAWHPWLCPEPTSPTICSVIPALWCRYGQPHRAGRAATLRTGRDCLMLARLRDPQHVQLGRVSAQVVWISHSSQSSLSFSKCILTDGTVFKQSCLSNRPFEQADKHKNRQRWQSSICGGGMMQVELGLICDRAWPKLTCTPYDSSCTFTGSFSWENFGWL